MTKNEFRTRFKKIRQDFVLSLDLEKKSSATRNLYALISAAPVTMDMIGGYAAMATELDPFPILAAFREKGCGIALPWFENRTAEMAFKKADGPLEPGPFGIQQPATGNRIVEPDTILVPLVATDTHGNRIGQGQGHFDRYLAKLRAKRPVVAIGLAWECQIADQLPADPWDQPLDYIATPDRLIKVTS